jgi:hypothetical protein
VFGTLGHDRNNVSSGIDESSTHFDGLVRGDATAHANNDALAGEVAHDESVGGGFAVGLLRHTSGESIGVSEGCFSIGASGFFGGVALGHLLG